MKGQWTSESADLPAVVFQLVDRMPMRQREAEENEAAGRDSRHPGKGVARRPRVGELEAAAAR